MSGWLEAHKPAASARLQLLLAALLWTIVGTSLLAVGCRWSRLTGDGAPLWLVAVALVAGVAKSRWILDRVAAGVVTRIESRGDGRCLGGFLSLRSWALVALMIGLGRFLRSWQTSRGILALLYLMVGLGLLLSSRLSWRSYLESRLRARRSPPCG